MQHKGIAVDMKRSVKALWPYISGEQLCKMYWQWSPFHRHVTLLLTSG